VFLLDKDDTNSKSCCHGCVLFDLQSTSLCFFMSLKGQYIRMFCLHNRWYHKYVFDIFMVISITWMSQYFWPKPLCPETLHNETTQTWNPNYSCAYSSVSFFSGVFQATEDDNTVLLTWIAFLDLFVPPLLYCIHKLVRLFTCSHVHMFTCSSRISQYIGLCCEHYPVHILLE
jgi:hypothetical protein